MTQKQEQVINELEQLIQDNIRNIKSPSLLFGKSGILLYLLYRYKSTKKEVLFDLMCEGIGDIIEYINDETNETTDTFSNGYTGFAWVLSKIKTELGMDELEEILSDFDALAITAIQSYTVNENFDYLHGGFGILLYLIDRNIISQSLTEVEAFVHAFEKALIKDENGARLQSPDYILSTEEVSKFNINLGMAHGSSAYIAILSKLSIHPYFSLKLMNTINDLKKYLLFCKLEKHDSYLYPSAISEEVTKPSRLSWCYGDLSAVIAFDWLNKTIDYSSDSSTEINAILDFSAERKTSEQTGYLPDPCLCHGAAGNALIFKSIAEKYGNQNGIEASLFWKEKIYDFCKEHKPLKFIIEDGGRYEENYSLLEGSTGVIMAVLTLEGRIEDSWKDVLLLS